MVKKNLFLIGFILMVSASVANAIDLTSGSWSTSFTCSSIDTCFDFANREGSATLCGEATTFQSINNKPGGTGNAMRVMVADGSNKYTYTGGYAWNTGQSELWIRFYIKYSPGFNWSSLVYDKLLYLHTAPFYDGGPISPVFEFAGSNNLTLAQMPGGNIIDNNVGWQSTMGGATSDGKWHAMEVYIKSDTGNNNGVYRAWIDGKRVANHTSVNFNQAKFYWFIMYDNQSSPMNTGGCAEVYIDDVAIYTTTPPNIDSSGYSFIGLTVGEVGNSTIEPSPLLRLIK